MNSKYHILPLFINIVFLVTSFILLNAEMISACEIITSAKLTDDLFIEYYTLPSHGIGPHYPREPFYFIEVIDQSGERKNIPVAYTYYNISPNKAYFIVEDTYPSRMRTANRFAIYDSCGNKIKELKVNDLPIDFDYGPFAIKISDLGDLFLNVPYRKSRIDVYLHLSNTFNVEISGLYPFYLSNIFSEEISWEKYDVEISNYARIAKHRPFYMVHDVLVWIGFMKAPRILRKK